MVCFVDNVVIKCVFSCETNIERIRPCVLAVFRSLFVFFLNFWVVLNSFFVENFLMWCVLLIMW